MTSSMQCRTWAQVWMMCSLSILVNTFMVEELKEAFLLREDLLVFHSPTPNTKISRGLRSGELGDHMSLDLKEGRLSWHQLFCVLAV